MRLRSPCGFLPWGMAEESYHLTGDSGVAFFESLGGRETLVAILVLDEVPADCRPEGIVGMHILRGDDNRREARFLGDNGQRSFDIPDEVLDLERPDFLVAFVLRQHYGILVHAFSFLANQSRSRRFHVRYQSFGLHLESLRFEFGCEVVLRAGSVAEVRGELEGSAARALPHDVGAAAGFADRDLAGVLPLVPEEEADDSHDLSPRRTWVAPGGLVQGPGRLGLAAFGERAHGSESFDLLVVALQGVSRVAHGVSMFLGIENRADALREDPRPLAPQVVRGRVLGRRVSGFGGPSAKRAILAVAAVPADGLA